MKPYPEYPYYAMERNAAKSRLRSRPSIKSGSPDSNI